MAKTISIGSKTITVTQLVIAIVLGAFALGGGFFGMLKAEDRWNQKSSCYENALKATKIEEDMIAGFQQMYYQQNVRFEENRLTQLYDELGKVKVKLDRDPNNVVYQQEFQYLMEEIDKVKNNLQKLHEERAQ
jgi:flagellar basal body-associated protein FliL